jgi:hypothetical protein
MSERDLRQGYRRVSQKFVKACFFFFFFFARVNIAA